ncbi:hypothetical protein LIER_11413 [Lithospermum erythrorhizon]|uniref:Uncharacterized protein n=1 Tax=Lithospermum erythrorhizon TaxID=34254 RepID=A0AAV3PQV0_LITER
MLWYLAKVCTFKLHVFADALLRYLVRCLLTDQDRKFKKIYKWLTLFHNATWWQENICKTMSILFVTVTFRIKTTILQDDGHMQIQKEFEANMAPELQICATIRTDRFGPSILNQVIEASKQSSRLLCRLNNVDPESLHPHLLLGNPSCRQDPELFPTKLRDKILRWLF